MKDCFYPSLVALKYIEKFLFANAHKFVIIKKVANQTRRFWSMGKEISNEYTIQLENNRGEIVIADEVIAVITGLAAMEVEGVASMAGNATRELISKIGIKSLSKGVSVDVLEDVVTVEAALNLKYGYNVKDVSVKVQEKVKVAIENMTGLKVADVNVRVAGIEVVS